MSSTTAHRIFLFAVLTLSVTAEKNAAFASASAPFPLPSLGEITGITVGLAALIAVTIIEHRMHHKKAPQLQAPPQEVENVGFKECAEPAAEEPPAEESSTAEASAEEAPDRKFASCPNCRESLPEGPLNSCPFCGFALTEQKE
jgi:hypothetical protein